MLSEPRQLRFFQTVPHPCSYLDGRTASTVVADPRFALDTGVHTDLAELGFRRSGTHVYRPHCAQCNACVPVRVPVERFRARRSQRRVARRNADLSYRLRPGAFDAAHFELYRAYQHARHGDGDMADHDEFDYRRFLFADWCTTELLEMHADGTLIAIAVLDVMRDGLSAVYTFFHPRAASRSPGVQAILWSIAEARRRHLAWLYLGYWIADCPKMSYKAEYLPQQRLLGDRWVEWPRELPRRRRVE